MARRGGELAGLGALKPVDAATAEIERMYVRENARGCDLGQLLHEDLLTAPRTERYRVARLEALPFMTAAQALYESLGFRDTRGFEASEAALSDFAHVTRYMAPSLDEWDPRAVVHLPPRNLRDLEH